MLKISFVVPYFKKLQSVEKCLKSLFAQSVKEIEVIVVKDGPDSEVDRVLKKFKKHKNFKVLEIEHGGASKARNAGLDAATGEYVCFWDADSYIEPGAADVWLKAFKIYSNSDFVYAGYSFQEGQGGIPSEPFDPWLLEVNNYISGHFPIKREKCPRWDESLKSLQDWDFWLQAVRAGCRGKHLVGYSFSTEYPDIDSISGEGCAPEKWLERLETVKKKHNIPLRDICVASIDHRDDGISLAKILDADFRYTPNDKPHKYKTIVQIGFNPHHADKIAGTFHDPRKLFKKILFWKGDDIQALYHQVPHSGIQAMSEILNRLCDFQFCEDKQAKEMLTKAGFKAVVFPFPMKSEGVEIKPLPKRFRVLIDVAQNYAFFFDGVVRSMPDVDFVKLEVGKPVNVDDFSLLMRFQHDKSIDQMVKQTLLSGRRVMSNVQAPFCGFVSDTQQDVESMRKEIIRKLRQAQEKQGVYNEGLDYYRVQCSPDNFKRAFDGVLNPTLIAEHTQEAKA